MRVKVCVPNALHLLGYNAGDFMMLGKQCKSVSVGNIMKTMNTKTIKRGLAE